MHTPFWIRSSATLIAMLATVSISYAQDISRPQPKLILQITVDQLRGDLPTRYYNRLSDGGIRYLWENGVVYRNAHHAHANTETIVGHATLATGAHPSAHGMVGNLWFDRETGFTTYNVEDPNYRLLTEGADVDEETEIDPTQRAARSEGRSPAAILVPTFSDELRSNNNGQSKEGSRCYIDGGTYRHCVLVLKGQRWIRYKHVLPETIPRMGIGF
jgi:hypothetical protein